LCVVVGCQGVPKMKGRRVVTGCRYLPKRTKMRGGGESIVGCVLSNSGGGVESD
jgi:hypothetical protein